MTVTVRPIIQAFAEAMERKLSENDGVKPEWSGERVEWLLAALQGEVVELAEALSSWVYWGAQWPDEVLSECADVALYAAMVADVVDALPATTSRGRVAISLPASTVRLATMLTLEDWEYA